jgi:hypothetical protein
MVVLKTSPSTLVSVALLFGFLANISSAAPDQATMDRCTQYSQRAVQQYLLMTSHPQCAVKPDLRWQDNLDNHYNGCLALPEFLRKSEEEAREQSSPGLWSPNGDTDRSGRYPGHDQRDGKYSRWCLDDYGRPGQAHWDGGGTVADLVVQRWDNGGVLIFRRNTPNSLAPGPTAIYSGQISGNKIVNGYVIWKWKGFPKGVAQGTWNASW